MKKATDIISPAHAPVVYAGLPAAVCVVGMSLLLMPGASPLVLLAGWLAGWAAVAVPYMRSRWSSQAGSWVLLFVSVLLAAGITANCYYYINVWGNGDVSAPVLMNFDAWSAWNNALFDNGRPDAMECSWPAKGYGHLVGIFVWLLGADICIPLLFNAFFALATIALTGSITYICGDGDERLRRRTATAAMIICSCMCYFLASGTILIKDTALAAALALLIWSALRFSSRHAAAMAAMALGTVLIWYCRPNYLLLELCIMVVFAIVGRGSQRSLCIAVALAAGIAWVCMQYLGEIRDIRFYADVSGRGFADNPGEVEHHGIFFALFNDYYSIPTWQRLMLLPATTGIQFLIPLPWTWDKYLVFGPMMALAHMSFFRYAAGILVAYFSIHQFRKQRAPLTLNIIVAIGLFFYVASAYQFGGTVSRYGIPLISMLVPAAAYCTTHYSRDPFFKKAMVLMSVALTIVLVLSYKFTSL